MNNPTASYGVSEGESVFIIRSQADIARREGLSRARVTQIFGLLRLAPEIQECILSLPKSTVRGTITERSLRVVIDKKDASQQKEAFAHINQQA